MIFRVDKHEPQIYTTGAFLRPLQIKDADGKDMWVWYVESFEGGDSFLEGNTYNPIEVAVTLDKLLDGTTCE